MGLRSVNTYAIVARREAQLDYVSPEDLTLGVPEPLGDVWLPDRTLAYCADLARERVLFTCHDADGLRRISAAAFMFGEQLETARSVISVPFERLDELPSAPPPPPVFIFSPGRTGSTLLMRLLAASGLACASEPDMLTQVLRLTRDELRLLPAVTRDLLVKSCIAPLGRVLGGGTFIKLRSQCNGRPLVLTAAAPGCRLVFMLRGIPAWALSRHRSFLEPPETVASILRQAIDALDKLAFSEADFAVLWFETLVTDPAAALRICAPQLTSEPACVAAVMALDSQAGTNIAREFVAGLPTQDGFLAAFLVCWAEAKAGAEWHPWTEAMLAEMWEREALS